MIKEKYTEYVKRWNASVEKDEWHFNKLRSEVISSVSAAQSFDALSEVVELLLQENDEYLCGELIDLLLALARKSETTEMPTIMSDKWHDIGAHILGFGDYLHTQYHELKSWYRR